MPNFLDAIRRDLHKERLEWEMFFATSAEEALELTTSISFDAIVSDVRMPGRSGLELLQDLSESVTTRDIPVVIVSGIGDRELTRQALDLGAFDLLTKPFPIEDLLARLRNVLRLKTYQDDLKRLNETLEKRVQQRTAELEESQLEIILRLAKSAELRDGNTGRHILRVAYYSRIICEELGVSDDLTRLIFLTSPLHDIGKLGIPDAILLKRSELTAMEREAMQQHCLIGAKILSEKPDAAWPNLLRNEVLGVVPHSTNRFLEVAASIALCHHEKWNGHGYPNCLHGEAIPQEARVVAVADVYDALSSARTYKPSFDEDIVLDIMQKSAGLHFEKSVIEALMNGMDRIKLIKTEFSEDTATGLAKGA